MQHVAILLEHVHLLDVGDLGDSHTLKRRLQTLVIVRGGSSDLLLDASDRSLSASAHLKNMTDRDDTNLSKRDAMKTRLRWDFPCDDCSCDDQRR